jgi:hypothetical protein
MSINTLWDVKKGLPDGRAFFCDSRGNPKLQSHAKYIAWPVNGATNSSTNTLKLVVPNGMLASEDCYIAKVLIEYVRDTPFDYQKQIDFPVDLLDAKNKRRIEHKISRILQNLGVAYADRAGLLMATNDVPTSAWLTNYKGQEVIAINPYHLLQSNMAFLTRMVKKEVIHRALYRNLHELSNKSVLNFTLDVLSMRVIAQTPAEHLDKVTVRLAEKLFDPKLYKKFPLMALCDCSLTPKQVKANIPHEIANIWMELYGVDKYGQLPSLRNIKPSTLYFKIKSLIDEIFISAISIGAGDSKSETKYPWNTTPSKDTNGNTLNDNSISSEFDKKNTALNKGVKESFVPRRHRNSRWFANSASDFWDQNVVQKKDFVNEKLREFAKKWRTEKLLEDVEAKLQRIIGRDEVELKPYPEELTYDGQILVALGISGPDCLPVYWNKDDSKENNRKKVAAFFDLSPSMTHLFPYMVRLVEVVEDTCDVTFSRNAPTSKADSNNFGIGSEEGGTLRGAYGFAGSVTELDEKDLEDMKKGKLKAGDSTCFNAILEHVFEKIEKDNIDIILCFTDGESDLSQENIDKFNESGRQFFRIYMTPYSGSENDRTHIESPLDALNGESFTLCLPPIDSMYTE